MRGDQCINKISELIFSHETVIDITYNLVSIGLRHDPTWPLQWWHTVVQWCMMGRVRSGRVLTLSSSIEKHETCVQWQSQFFRMLWSASEFCNAFRNIICIDTKAPDDRTDAIIKATEEWDGKKYQEAVAVRNATLVGTASPMACCAAVRRGWKNAKAGRDLRPLESAGCVAQATVCRLNWVAITEIWLIHLAFPSLEVFRHSRCEPYKWQCQWRNSRQGH